MTLLNVITLQMFQNKMKISPTVLTVKYYKFSTGFICNDKHISDSNAYSECGIGRCKIDYAKKYLIKQTKYYESDKSNWVYEAPCRLKFFVIDNLLIILASIYIIISLAR